MLRMIKSMSPAGAKKYFTSSLEQADYYIEEREQERQGQIKGQLAKRLGLTGPVTREVFFDLCENINPKTKQPLTPRTKEERICGFDCNFHAPKSVSILSIYDEKVLDVFQSAVSETVEDIERDAVTRIRLSGVYKDRTTGNMIYSEFLHLTARPVDKETPPDPHIHSHVYIWNCTFDEQENRIKALKWRDTVRDAPFYEKRFHKRLSDKLIDLGYKTRRTDHSFEIVGIPTIAIDAMSKRTNHIGQVAKELGIKDDKRKSALGALTRSAKQKGLTMQQLKDHWTKELQSLNVGKEGDTPIRFAPAKEIEKQGPEETIQHALDHAFERASVMDERRLLRTAYNHALGHRGVSLDDIDAALSRDPRLLRMKKGSRTLCTTQDVLAEEMRMVQLAKLGKGQLAPLYDELPSFETLKDQQADAATHVLTTKDRVSIVMGAAGTGKTTLMREMREKIEAVGKQVYAFAPTTEAARVLQEEGFQNADTMARLLVDEKLQQQIEGQTIFLDEAGLAGTQDMTRVLTVANERNCRLILCGDTRQHSSVLRGDALRVLNTVGGIQAAEVSKIHRQKDPRYRAAVQDLTEGKVKEAFDRLDAMGSIKVIDPLDPNTQLANDYIAAVKKGRKALIVSPTHEQGEALTEVLRSKLRDAKLIGEEETKLTRFVGRDLTEAQKNDSRNFVPGQVVRFHQHVKGGIKKGSSWTVKTIKGKDVEIEDKQGKTLTLPPNSSKHFDIYDKSEIGISKGDILRMTCGGCDEEERRINNGMILEVASISKDGRVILRNPVSKAKYILGRDYGHFSHARVLTSVASQGKSVDEVFISQPANTFKATDLKNFYVSMSRGKLALYVYTDDKEGLLEHTAETGDRQSAIELVNGGHDNAINPQRQNIPDIPPIQPEQNKPYLQNPEMDRGYEPGA